MGIKNHLPIAIVVWRDAISDESTHRDNDGICPLEITSVGYFWFEDKDKLVLARDYFPQNNYRGLIVIPREAILEIERFQ